MDRIGLDAVCRQVSSRQAGAIEYALENGLIVFPYSKSDFELDLLADGFVSSRTTVTAKWRMLIASGVVTERAGRTFLSVPEVRARTQPVKRRASA